MEKVETRVLKGCVRVGDLANGLLLKGDKSLEMLVFCTDKPTVYMLQNVKEKFEELLTVREEGFVFYLEIWGLVDQKNYRLHVYYF